MIVGIRNNSKLSKYLFSENRKYNASNINAYLANAQNTIIEKRQKTISDFPTMMKGSQPTDGGNLILSKIEKEMLIDKHPKSQLFIRKLSGSEEFINGSERWCFWITSDMLEKAIEIEDIKIRIEKVRQMRLLSSKKATQDSAKISYAFGEIRFLPSNSIIVPSHSSENRDYIPLGFLDESTIISNSAFAIYNAQNYLFAILNSNMHMTWVRAVCGSLETRIRYSNTLCYNTFPFPPITEYQKEELTQCVFRILEERENHSEKTLAQLYDPVKMPEGLREAHRLNDLAVERCYRSKPFESDEERLEYLFKLYEKMIAEEKEKGTLFAAEKKAKKIKI